MAEAPFRVGDPTLAELLRRLVAAYLPERVYLFGSRARGEARPDSDYDLLLVVPDDAPPERQRSRLAYEVLRGTVWRRTFSSALGRGSTVARASRHLSPAPFFERGT